MTETEKHKLWRKTYPETIKKNSRRNNQARAEWFRGLKDNKPCTDCKIVYPYYIMQWDHIGPKTWNKRYRAVVHMGLSREATLKELENCELVCANCHAKRTWERAPKSWSLPPNIQHISLEGVAN